MSNGFKAASLNLLQSSKQALAWLETLQMLIATGKVFLAGASPIDEIHKLRKSIKELEDSMLLELSEESAHEKKN